MSDKQAYEAIRGPCMTTASGRRFYPGDPRPEEIDIWDIANSLSRICRFNGHIKDNLDLYSVAQHSCLVCDYVEDPKLKLAALLHDATEFAVGDMTTPVKILHTDRKNIEWHIDVAIAERFGLDPKDFSHPDIKRQDIRAVLTEHRDLRDDLTNNGVISGALFNIDEIPWEKHITPWSRIGSRNAFMNRFRLFYKGDYDDKR